MVLNHDLIHIPCYLHSTHCFYKNTMILPLYISRKHNITMVPCLKILWSFCIKYFHMFPFLFAHTPSEHQICACVSKCVGVYLCVWKKTSQCQWGITDSDCEAAKNSPLFLWLCHISSTFARWAFLYCMTPSMIHFPSAESRLALSKSALFPLSVTYWRLFSVWWFSAKRDHLRSSDLHPQSVNQSVSALWPNLASWSPHADFTTGSIQSRKLAIDPTENCLVWKRLLC